MRVKIIASLLTALIAASASAADVTPSCRGSWNVVGACFALHGTLSLAKPPARGASALVSSADAKRVFGILGRSYQRDGLPPAVAEAMRPDPFNTIVEGDFTLCPLDRDREREPLRLVCIEAAENLRVRGN